MSRFVMKVALKKDRNKYELEDHALDSELDTPLVDLLLNKMLFAVDILHDPAKVQRKKLASAYQQNSIGRMATTYFEGSETIAANASSNSLLLD